jgi:hypothetical protein
VPLLPLKETFPFLSIKNREPEGLFETPGIFGLSEGIIHTGDEEFEINAGVRRIVFQLVCKWLSEL